MHHFFLVETNTHRMKKKEIQAKMNFILTFLLLIRYVLWGHFDLVKILHTALCVELKTKLNKQTWIKKKKLFFFSFEHDDHYDDDDDYDENFFFC